MINVTNIEITNEDFNTTSDKRYLFGNVFNKIKALIEFEVITYAIATIDSQIEFSPNGYPDLKHIIDVNGGGMFKDFKSGDIIIVDGTTSNDGIYTIDVKFSDNDIRITAALTNELSSSGQIYLQQEYTASDFYFNLIENNEQPNFLSKVDNSIQKFSAKNIDVATQQLMQQGYLSGFIDGGTYITRNTLDTATYKQTFVITQIFYISPFFLSNQDINTPPSYFLNDNALKYIFKIDIKPNSTDKTRVQSTVFDYEIGQTGWFNENFNGGDTNYSIDNLTFKRVSDSQLFDALLFNSGEVTEVEFDINNTIDSPFNNTTSKATINFINIPQLDSEYKNLYSGLDENFSFDRVNNTVVGSAAVGDYARAIIDYEVQYVSASKIHIKFKIDLSLSVYNKIGAMDIKKYLLAIAIKNTDTDIADSDLVTLLVDYNDFFIDLGLDAAIEQIDNKFIEQPYQDKAFGVTSLDSFLEDEVVGYKRIKIDTSLSAKPFTISSVNAGILMTNGSETVELSKYSINTVGSTVVNGLEFIDKTIKIPFKAPDGELVTEFKVLRDIASDSSPVYFFDVYLGWLNRWEYWIKNNEVPSDFFNIALPNNGLNDNWERFDSLGYSLEFFVDFNLTIDGATQRIRRTSSFTINNYNSNSDWINEDIKTYDESNNQLISGSTEYILGYQPTKVVCEFEYAGASPVPSVSEVAMIMRIEPKENGGQFTSTRINSERESGAESQWESIDLSDKIVITNIGNVFYGTAKLDNFKLLNFNIYSITSRIYIKTFSPSSFKLFQDGDEFLFQDGNNYAFQDQ